MTYLAEDLAKKTYKELQAIGKELKINVVGKDKSKLIDAIVRLTSSVNSPIVVDDENITSKIKVVTPVRDITCHIGGKWFTLSKGVHTKVTYDVYRILKSAKLIE